MIRVCTKLFTIMFCFGMGTTFAQQQLVYEVPVVDPEFAPFATEIVTDASFRHVVKSNPRHPERIREFIKLEYTLPPNLVGVAGFKVDMEGELNPSGKPISLRSDQGTAICVADRDLVYSCRMIYVKENLLIDIAAAEELIEQSGLTQEQIVGKKAVMRSFSGEPIGILHGMKLEKKIR